MQSNIKDIAADSEIRDVFLLAQASIQQARNGPYWKLELRKKNQSLDAKIWSPLSQEFTSLSSGIFVEVTGRSSLFRDQVQIIVDRMHILTEEQCQGLNLADFMPSSPRPAEEMWDELYNMCKKEFKHPTWKKFVFSVLKNDDIKKAWIIAPAAKGVHHAYAGGLLEHSLGVAQLCLSIAANYPEIDKQTLLAGAIFHDLGKIWEFSGGLVNDYTTEGRLLGHMELGLEKLQPFLQKSQLEPEFALHFKHLILSHHGSYEFGSARLPQTAEAMLLHFADNIDAKMAQCRGIFSDLDVDMWSNYQPTLERHMYNAPSTPCPPDPLCQDSKKQKNSGGEQCLSLLKV